VFGEADAVRRIEITRCQQRYRTTLLGAAAHAGKHFVDQCGVQTGIDRTAGEIHVGRAAGWTLGTDHIDLTGVALHARLDTNPHTGFAAGGHSGTAQAFGHRGGKLVGMLPGGGELAGFRTLSIETETVILEELHGHWPDFSGWTLGHDPTRVSAFLQAVVAGLGHGRQRLWTRYYVFALGGVVGHVTRDRQQRVETLGSADIRRQLHWRSLFRLQIIA